MLSIRGSIIELADPRLGGFIRDKEAGLGCAVWGRCVVHAAAYTCVRTLGTLTSDRVMKEA